MGRRKTSIIRIGGQGEKNCAPRVHSGLTSRIFGEEPDSETRGSVAGDTFYKL